MNGRAYSARVEGAKYGASFGSALAVAISYTTNTRSSGDHPRDPELAVRRLLRAVQPSDRIRVLLQVHYPSGLPLCLNIFRVRWARTGTVFFWSPATGENHPTFKLG
jgi:hypothetical protein